MPKTGIMLDKKQTKHRIPSVSDCCYKTSLVRCTDVD